MKPIINFKSDYAPFQQTMLRYSGALGSNKNSLLQGFFSVDPRLSLIPARRYQKKIVSSVTNAREFPARKRWLTKTATGFSLTPSKKPVRQGEKISPDSRWSRWSRWSIEANSDKTAYAGPQFQNSSVIRSKLSPEEALYFSTIAALSKASAKSKAKITLLEEANSSEDELAAEQLCYDGIRKRLEVMRAEREAKKLDAKVAADAARVIAVKEVKEKLRAERENSAAAAAKKPILDACREAEKKAKSKLDLARSQGLSGEAIFPFETKFAAASAKMTKLRIKNATEAAAFKEKNNADLTGAMKKRSSGTNAESAILAEAKINFRNANLRALSATDILNKAGEGGREVAKEFFDLEQRLLSEATTQLSEAREKKDIEKVETKAEKKAAKAARENRLEDKVAESNAVKPILTREEAASWFKAFSANSSGIFDGLFASDFVHNGALNSEGNGGNVFRNFAGVETLDSVSSDILKGGSNLSLKQVSQRRPQARVSDLKLLTAKKLAYHAGLFDTDGSLMVLFVKGATGCVLGWRISVRASFSQKSVRNKYLQEICDEIGIQTLFPKKGTVHPQSNVSIDSTEVLKDYLERIEPYLKLKGPRVSLGRAVLELLPQIRGASEANIKLFVSVCEMAGQAAFLNNSTSDVNDLATVMEHLSNLTFLKDETKQWLVDTAKQQALDKVKRDLLRSQEKLAFQANINRSRPVAKTRGPLNVLSETDKSYIGGALDGDGCFSAVFTKDARSPFGFRIRVSVVLSQLSIRSHYLNLISQITGVGSVSDKDSGMSEYSIKDAAALREILTIIGPETRMKRARAALCLQLLDLLPATHNDINFFLKAGKLVDKISGLNDKVGVRTHSFQSVTNHLIKQNLLLPGDY